MPCLLLLLLVLEMRVRACVCVLRWEGRAARYLAAICSPARARRLLLLIGGRDATPPSPSDARSAERVALSREAPELCARFPEVGSKESQKGGGADFSTGATRFNESPQNCFQIKCFIHEAAGASKLGRL